MLIAQRVMQAGRAVQFVTRTLGHTRNGAAVGCAPHALSAKPPPEAARSLRHCGIAATAQNGAGSDSASAGPNNEGFSECVAPGTAE